MRKNYRNYIMKNKREQLLLSFNELYSIEKRAYEYYQDQLKEDLSINEARVITGIMNDEKCHMDTVKKIINLIEEAA